MTSVALGQEITKSNGNGLLVKCIKLNSETNVKVDNLEQNTMEGNVQLVKQSPKIPKRIKPISVPRNKTLQKQLNYFE